MTRNKYVVCRRCGKRRKMEAETNITKGAGRYIIYVRADMTTCGVCQRELAQKTFEATVKELHEWDK